MVTTDELVAELTAVKDRLARCESVLAIQELKARYGELVDLRYSRGRVLAGPELSSVADRVAALFTPDGAWDGGPGLGRVVGRDAIAARLGQPTLDFGRHFFVNPRIAVDRNRATGRWDVLSPCRRVDGSSYWMVGYEDDEYEMVDGAWLFSSMKLTTVVMTPVGEAWSEIYA